MCAAEFRAGHKAVVIVLPTGGGKTLLSGEIIRRHLDKVPNGKALFCAHREELISQTFDAFVKLGLLPSVIMASPTRIFNPYRRVQIASTQTLLARNAIVDGVTLLILDECVTPDTLVGGKRADAIRIGDTVQAWDGEYVVNRRITHVFENTVSTLCKIKIEDRELVVSWNHPIWVENKGYIDASKVSAGDMCRVWQPDNERLEGKVSKDLQYPMPKCSNAEEAASAARTTAGMHDMQEPNDMEILGVDEDLLARVSKFGTLSNNDEDKSCSLGQVVTEDVRVESYEDTFGARCSFSETEKNELEATHNWWERETYNNTSSDFTGCAWSRMGYRTVKVQSPNPSEMGYRYCTYGTIDSNRSRWSFPQFDTGSNSRYPKNKVSNLARVDSVEILEPGSDGTFGGMCPNHKVYNFEVEGNHNFFANGILTHNCHHYLSPMWAKVGEQYKSRGARIVGLSATPIRSDGIGLGHN